MIPHQFVNILVTVTLVEMMLAIGLGVSFEEVVVAIRDLSRLARAVIANYIVVPALALALLEFFVDPPGAAVGILILAAFPGASYGPPFTKFARGDVPLSVGLMVLLAASSAIVGPILLRVLLHLTSDNASLTINVPKVIAILGMAQLVPLGAGMCVRRFAPRLASRLLNPAEIISKVLNGCSIVAVLTREGGHGAPFQTVSPFTILTLFLTSLAAGYLFGGPGAEGRKASALTTSLRNVGVSIVVAAGQFADSTALPTVVGYAIIEISGSLIVALWWGRRRTAVSHDFGRERNSKRIT